MIVDRRLGLVTASVIATLAIALPAAAQGKSGEAPGRNRERQTTPPSSSSLPAVTPSTSIVSPLSWLDDASLLAPGSGAFTISMSRWSGGGLSEVSVPIVDAAVGVTKRFQLSATVPHVVGGDDVTGPVGGWGTSYFSGKIAVHDDGRVKVALAPVFEILGAGAALSRPEGESRFQVGLPLSVEVASGSVRMFASTGFFTRGAWFAGGGAGFPLSPRSGASLSFTRSWSRSDVEGLNRSRSEIAGGVYYFVKSQIAIYGSMGRTVATSDENGDGLTLGTGVTFLLVPRQPAKRR